MWSLTYFVNNHCRLGVIKTWLCNNKANNLSLIRVNLVFHLYILLYILYIKFYYKIILLLFIFIILLEGSMIQKGKTFYYVW